MPFEPCRVIYHQEGPRKPDGSEVEGTHHNGKHTMQMLSYRGSTVCFLKSSSRIQSSFLGISTAMRVMHKNSHWCES